MKVAEWITPESLTLIEGWARSGLTDEQVASNMGINRATLYRWKKQNSDLCNALKKGREVADFEVENALFKAATGGNVTACIFWLKNRMPEKWKDVQSGRESLQIEKLKLENERLALQIEALKDETSSEKQLEKLDAVLAKIAGNVGKITV